MAKISIEIRVRTREWMMLNLLKAPIESMLDELKMLLKIEKSPVIFKH